MHVLVSGAGPAGLSLAFWLTKAGHKVTIVERGTSLRKNGLQVDLRGPGVEVLKLMDLEAKFREHAAPEQGVRMVTSSGRQFAYFQAGSAAEDRKSFTAEYEIMRGDLCQLLYDAVDDKVEFVWGTTITTYTETPAGLDATFSTGEQRHFDILVAADGQLSATRTLIFGEEGASSLQLFKNVHIGYFTIPEVSTSDTDYVATMYLAGKSRMVMTRRSNASELQVYLMCRTASEILATCRRGDAAAEIKGLDEIFRDGGWRCEELCDAMKSTNNFYLERMGRIGLPHWSRGRAVVVGDAGFGASAATGNGTTAAIVGAYVLAKELETHCPETGSPSMESIESAFGAFETKFRPFMDILLDGISEDSIQLKFMAPSSRLMIAGMMTFSAITSFFKLDTIFRRFLGGESDKWQLPKYSEGVAV